MPQAEEFLNYWRSTHGLLPPRNDIAMAEQAIKILFSGIDPETGRMSGQISNIFYHGTTSNLIENLKSEGLRAREGSACLSRNIRHTLNFYALNGNYTAITNGSVDSEIKKLKIDGIVSSKSDEDEAGQSFRHWCKDENREREGLLSIWQPPTDQIGLDCKENKIHKRHFALYEPRNDQSISERRKELNGKPGNHIFLGPEFLVALFRPTVELRSSIVTIEKEIMNHTADAFELTSALQKAKIELFLDYDIDDLANEILKTIYENKVFDLTRSCVLNNELAEDKFQELKNIVIPIAYIDNYRNMVVEKIKQRGFEAGGLPPASG